jgi:hypothetical protein
MEDPSSLYPGSKLPRNRHLPKETQDGLEQLVSKYLLGDSQSFVTETVTGPDDHFEPPSWLLTEVAKVAKEDVTTPQEPPVQFTMDNEGAAQNSAILKRYDFDLERLVEDNKETALNYRSEFRPLHQLQGILGEHPHFPELEKKDHISRDGLSVHNGTTRQCEGERT